MTEKQPATRLIQYVGAKPSKIDNVAFSGAVWSEPGAVVPVHEATAAKLLKHPDVWRDITEDADCTVEANKPPPPADFPGDRGDQIMAAINTMDPDSPEHFTKPGKPRVEIIEELLGYDITAAERNDAWDRIIQAHLAMSHGDAAGNVPTPPIDAG